MEAIDQEIGSDLPWANGSVLPSTSGYTSAISTDALPGSIEPPPPLEAVPENPPPSRLSEWTIRTVAIIALFYALYYVTWRWLNTLNPDALWFSVPLALGETWGVLMFAGLIFNTWKLKRRPWVKPADGLNVAVFITTYDEPLSVVRKTAIAAREIRYPHNTYLLDDGRRPEVAQLASELGVRYISRDDNEHAKAGNLNNALELTDEEFILQLDADHAPLPVMLDRLLGYFQDEQVAFVQSAQDFYNFDSFTHVVHEPSRRIWEEQRLFFNVIQPGKDNWNAAFFCGSCGILRRKAFEEVGGFSTQTVTEDVETSLKLHARGWKSVYVDESLAFGLSPGSLFPYQVQRLRWGQGSMQILRKLNPLTMKGLSIPQRISYFLSLVHYFDGCLRMLFIVTPFIYFLTGVLPVFAVETELLKRLFINLFLMIAAFELLARGHGYIWISEKFQMARWPTYVQAVAALFMRKPLGFRVTPKGDDTGAPVRAYLPQLAIVVLTPVVLLWATIASRMGWVDYGAPGWHSGAFLVGASWMLWNVTFAVSVVRMARRRRQDEEYRFREAVPVRFHIEGRSGLEAKPGMGMTQELGGSGLRFLSTTPLEVMERLHIHLPLSTGKWNVQGRVIDRTVARRAGIDLFDYHVTFGEMPLETQLGIELHCVHHSVPARRQQFLARPDLFEDMRIWFNERRRDRRVRVQLPAQVGVLEDGGRALRWHPAVLEQLSRDGLLLITDRRVEEDAWLRCQIPGASLDADGIVRHARFVETPGGQRWAVGVQRRGSRGITASFRARKSRRIKELSSEGQPRLQPEI